MRPETVGRVLGTGLRVAGRVAGQRINAASQPSPSARQAANGPPAGFAQPAQQPRRQGSQRANKTNGSLARGVGGFFKPFQRVGGIIWLEVTGVFFLLPVLVFAPTVWRTRLSYAQGPDHRTFIASTIVVVVFFYLGVSSFWRARKKSGAK